MKEVKNKHFYLSAIQMVSVDEPEQNIGVIKRLLAELKPSINQLVLLPENALSFADKESYISLAETLGDGYFQSQLALLADQYQCYLVCGSFPIKADGMQEQIYTTSLVFSPQGKLIAHYHKIHLFDAQVADVKGLYKESDTFLPGQSIQLFDWSDGVNTVKVGLTICYDLRFPALFQALREKGADVILLPAAFTQETGLTHWLPLLQARAIENQCYIIAANQGGMHPCGRQTYGHSMIISPWGKVIEKVKFGEGVIQSKFEASLVNEIRLAMPVLQHNRFLSSTLDL